MSPRSTPARVIEAVRLLLVGLVWLAIYVAAHRVVFGHWPSSGASRPDGECERCWEVDHGR